MAYPLYTLLGTVYLIMNRPKIAKILIQWIDENGEEHKLDFNENTLEDAETIIGLMTGNICEDDLKP